MVADVKDPSLSSRAGTFDTVVMNPPFGAQKKHADRPFIDLALVLAPVTYGIFNAGSAPFVRTYTEGPGAFAALVTLRLSGARISSRKSRRGGSASCL